MKIKKQGPIKCFNKTKKYYYIYCIYIKSKNWYYIGQRHLPVKYTKIKEDIDYYGSGKIITNYIKKHGTKNLIKNILYKGYCSKKYINKLEQKFIQEYINKYGLIKDGGKCINLTSGGEGGNVFEFKTKKERKKIAQKIALKIKGRIKSKEEIKHNSEANKNHVTYNNGIVERRIKKGKKIPKGFKKGRLPFSKLTRKHMGRAQKGKIISKYQKEVCSNYAKNAHWFNNGIQEKFCPQNPGKNWHKGRLPQSKLQKLRHSKTSKKLKWWYKGNEAKFQEICPGEGWYNGRPKKHRQSLSKSFKGKKKLKKLHIYNNGKIEVRKYLCPKGFVKGRLKRKKKC